VVVAAIEQLLAVRAARLKPLAEILSHLGAEWLAFIFCRVKGSTCIA
jgi:hypothetical protein